MSIKGDCSYVLISISNLFFLIFACFRQHFVPMPVAFHVNLTSFFQMHFVISIKQWKQSYNFYGYTLQLLYVKFLF